MTVEELQKACAALSEAWVKAMEPLKKLAEALNSVSGQIEQSEEKRKIHIPCMVVVINNYAGFYEVYVRL